MCGIFYTDLDISDAQLNGVISLLEKRGPDAFDSKRIGNKIFAHTRLALVDLDPRSNQPFSYEHLVTVFNGEIYNFRTIREELESLGYKFTTTGDVEVLLAGYLEYGEKILDKLIGMFAFVIYDSEKQELFCARDRLGKKPFFYAFRDGSFTAASSVDPIVTAIQGAGKSVTLSTESVQSYFATKCTSFPESIYKEIYSLGAGEYMFVRGVEEKTVVRQKYWDAKEVASRISEDAPSFSDACNTLEGLLSKAVEDRLIADVPVGVLMSGGIDSTLVAAMAQQKTNTPIKAFTIAFDKVQFDESGVASEVAKSLGLEHHISRCSSNDLLELIDDLATAYDEPFADTSALPTLLVSKFASQHVKAVLTGDGADEVFLGYNRYSQLSDTLPMLSAWGVLPSFVRKGVTKPLTFLPEKWARKARIASELSSAGKYYSAFLKTDVSRWYRGALSEFDDVFQGLPTHLDPISCAGLYDLENYLLNDINVKVDRASMYYSLETRAPFLDHRVVEYGLRLPKDYKLNSNTKKVILREIAARHLPKEVIEMRKRGFSVPLASWFKNELSEYVRDTLTPQALKGIDGVDPDSVLNMIREHMSGKINAQNDIWKLLVYTAWINKRR
ncbi:asparagine synthase (glutamine-hydrolyzing) [Enterovibrio sp. Hal110]